MVTEPKASTEPTSQITVESVSPVVTSPEQVVKPPEPTPEEILNQKISEAVSKALATETEKSRRELQSAKDKALAEVQTAQRRARLAETTLGATQKHLETLDPETAKEFELARLRAESSGRQSLEQEEQAAQYQMAVVQKFHENMTQFITGLGVDPNDKRVDWASDAPDLLTAQQRILDSVARIQKENVKSTELELDKKIKEAEVRIKKELGYVENNSVSTTASLGASSDGIPTDLSKFKEWVATLSQKEYESKSAKIKEMMQAGKIK